MAQGAALRPTEDSNKPMSQVCSLICSVIYFLKFIYLIYIFLAALRLHCCVRAFSSCSEQGLLFVAVHGLLIVMVSLVAEHRL